MWPQHVNLCSIERYWKEFSKNFPLGVIYPQNLKIEGVKQVLYLDQPRPIAQGRTGEILFTPLCSPGARKLSGQKTFCVKLRRVRVPKFSHFVCFPHTTRQNSTFLCAAYSPGVTLQKASVIAYSGRFKKVSLASGVVPRRMVGKQGTPKVAKIFAYGKYVCICTQCYCIAPWRVRSVPKTA